MFGKKKEVKEKEKPVVFNAIVITPGVDGLNGSVKFEKVDSPPGMARKCLNNSTPYHIVTRQNGQISAIRLPDKVIYYEPKEYINALGMPCNGKFFGWVDDLWQKISIGAMVLVIFIEIIGFALVG